MSILEKPAGNLTAEDYKDIAKPLGERVPYPGMGLGYVVGKNGERKLTRYLGVLEKPLMVTSERDLDEVEGMLIRNMPTPEMLKLFFEVMGAINPQNERRAMYLKGAPGAGKTFLGELAGNVSSQKGAVKVDCTNMNLHELFFETVLDFNANKRFYDGLNAKIEKYNEATGDADYQASILNPMSVDILRDALGEAFTEENGKLCIDWGAVKSAHRDSDGNPLDTRESIEIAIAGLKKVSAKEGLDSLGGNALGMATQAGPAWQAYQEGRVLILDELNRAKRGTFGILHGWMQFVIGEIPECRVRNPLKEKGDQIKSELVFKRSDMAAGHFVFMTGNTEDDSDEVLELPEALSSRVVPDPIAKATIQGWQHRWCQILTGMPVSTLYASQPAVWDKDKEGFGEKLQEWRQLRETRDVPEYQLNMLRRWEDVNEATENLAKFMDSASKAIDPDSEWHRAGTLTQLLDDINETFKKEVSVDFRKIGYFITKAMQSKPVVRPPQDENSPEIVPLISDVDVPENISEMKNKLGSHITYVILDWIISNSYERGKDDLGNQLMQLAADCALVDPSLMEGMKSNRKTIAQLLDENPFDNPNPDVRAKLVRDLMCDYLRAEYPEITADNDDIMPVSVVERAVGDLADKHDGLVVFNTDPEMADSAPLRDAYSIDVTPNPADPSGNAQKPATDKLLSQAALLATLAAPGLREQNMQSLWNKALSGTGVVSAGDAEGLRDKSLAMAENDDDSEIAVTTVMVKGGTEANLEEQALHLVWNKALDRILVVGEGEIGVDLKRAFNDARVNYVDRKAENAVNAMQTGFDFVLGGKKALGGTVRDAFLLRNKLDSISSEMGVKSPAELLMRDDLECYLPNYLAEEKPEAPRALPKPEM